MRGRLVSYVASDVPVDEDGTREPAGLLTWLANGSRYGAKKSWNALTDAAAWTSLGTMADAARDLIDDLESGLPTD